MWKSASSWLLPRICNEMHGHQNIYIYIKKALYLHHLTLLFQSYIIWTPSLFNSKSVKLMNLSITQYLHPFKRIHHRVMLQWLQHEKNKIWNLSPLPACLLHIHDLNHTGETEFCMSLGQTNQRLQLPWVGSDMSTSTSDFTHVNISLDQSLRSQLAQFWMDMFSCIRDVISQYAHVLQRRKETVVDTKQHKLHKNKIMCNIFAKHSTNVCTTLRLFQMKDTKKICLRVWFCWEGYWKPLYR